MSVNKKKRCARILEDIDELRREIERQTELIEVYLRFLTRAQGRFRIAMAELLEKIEDAVLKVLEIMGEATLEELGRGVAVLLCGEATGVQVRDAVQRLEARGLIEVESRLVVKPK